MSKIPPGDFMLSPLKEASELVSFDCSKDDPTNVNDFYRKDAWNYHVNGLSSTTLFKYRDEVVGCISLCMSSIRNDGRVPEPGALDWFGSRIPALFVGQMATHNNHRNRGVSKNMLIYAYGLAVGISRKIGARYVWLETDGSLVGFYEKCGFKTFDRRAEYVLMFRKIIAD